MRGSVSLSEQLRALDRAGQLRIVKAPVSTHLELAEIHRRVVALGGPALLFENVQNSDFPVATNLLGSPERMRLALGTDPEDILGPLLKVVKEGNLPSWRHLFTWSRLLFSARKGGTRKRRSGRVTECTIDPPDLHRLPLLTSWPLDGGAFATLPLVFSKPREAGAPNLGIYRLQRFDSDTLGLHMQIGKGGGFHLFKAESCDEDLPITIFFGGPPALTLSAIAPLPENTSELLMASWLMQQPIDVCSHRNSPHPLIADCEFALIGHCPAHQRCLEGPFGDHFGYYSLAHPFPRFKCQRIFHRKGAIFPATVVGKPPQEDLYIGDYLQKMISPLIPLIMPGVRALWSYGAGGFHTLSSACVHERYEREALAHAFRILGEGQLSLTKCLLIVDQCDEVRSLKKILDHLLRRFHPQTDCYVFPSVSMDTLDYNGPRLNRGSKMVLIGTGSAHRSLPEKIAGSLPSFVDNALPFCPGCLLIEASKLQVAQFSILLACQTLERWPLIALVEDIEKASKSEESFIWHIFTRFDPAQDLYARQTSCNQNYVMRSGPLLIDARTKRNLPPQVEVDPMTFDKVSRRWGEYFPKGL